MNPNTPDTPVGIPTDALPVTSENTNSLVTEESISISTENNTEPAQAIVGELPQEVNFPEIASIPAPNTVAPTTSVESTPIVALAPLEATSVTESTPTEVAPIIPVISTMESPLTPSTPTTANINPPTIANTPDTPKKGKGILFGVLGVLGLTILGSVGFAGYTYYDRVTHPDWSASEIGVFIRDGVIDSLASHAMTLSGSEPTFTTINTNYSLSGEGKGLEVTGFKNANATLNMSGSAYMEPMTASGNLPVFDGSFTLKFSIEGSGDTGLKGSVAVGVDAKSTGGDVIYIRPSSINLSKLPLLGSTFGEDGRLRGKYQTEELQETVDELNKTYLGKWYRIDLKQAGEELPKLVSEIPDIPYGIPTESLDTEKILKQQQEAEKQMKEHLGKLKAIFDKHTIIKATARDTGWKSYLNPRSITYDASLDQDGLSALLLDSYEWLKDTPIGGGKTAGVTYNMEAISTEEKEKFQKFIKGITLEFTLSGDMKKHGDMELKKFTFQQDETSPTLELHDFMKTKVERNDSTIEVVRSGSICGITETQSGVTKSICEEKAQKQKEITEPVDIGIPFDGFTEYENEYSNSRPDANLIYAINATLKPQNFSLSGNIDVFPYDYEKKNFNEKAAHINIDMQLVTVENTVNKFSQKMNFNVDANVEQANTKVKFSLDGSQTTEKVAKRVIDPVSESIDVIEMFKSTFGKINKSLDSTFGDTQNKALSTARISQIHLVRTVIEAYQADNGTLPESSNGCMLNTSVIADLLSEKSRQQILSLLDSCEIKYAENNNNNFYLLSKLESDSQATLFLTDEELQSFFTRQVFGLNTFVASHQSKTSENQSGYYYFVSNY